jgi:hypothetical protein
MLMTVDRVVSVSVKCVPKNDLDTNLHFMTDGFLESYLFVSGI